MKSVNQQLEQRMHRMVRTKVRSSTQPGTLWNIIESEMAAFLTELLENKLREEQEQLLQRKPYQRGGDQRKRNGFKLVRLKGLFHRLLIRRPVLRTTTPHSPLMMLFQSFGHGLVALLASRFWLRGTATRAVADELNRACGTKLSAADVSAFSQTILPDALAWLQRPIPNNIDYLFLDALYLPVRKPGFTTKQALLAAVGITAQKQRVPLGFMLGDRENNDSWNTFLKDLLNRGLSRENLKLVISDDHKAISAAVQETLAADHQLCVVHKMRNALCRVAAKHRKEFYADFTAVYWANTKDEALRALGRLEAKWGNIYPQATKIACDRPEAFLRFMDQPHKMWKTLRSTNLIERFNREIRRRLNSAGAMQSENELWKLLWSIATAQELRWDKRYKTQNIKELQKAA